MQILNDESRVMQERILQDELVARLLAGLQVHHEDSYHHSLRVGLLSLDLGLELGINQGHLTVLGYAAHLHDIGKRLVSGAILEKASALNVQERGIIEKHPREGFVVLGEEGLRDARLLVVSHHEFQRSPYPRAKKDNSEDGRLESRRGEKEHLRTLGEILALADMFDALTSKRSYKDSLSMRGVERIVRSEFMGDRVLIDKVLKRFPVSVKRPAALRRFFRYCARRIRDFFTTPLSNS